MHSLKLQIYRHLPKPVQLLIRRTLFPTYLVAAKVIVTNEEGKFLAVKTTYGPGWDIPSGHSDRNESPTLTAARELLEETGLVATNLTNAAVIFQPKTNIVQVIFTANAANPEALTADKTEISEVRWITEGEIELNPYANEALEVVNKYKVQYWVSELDH